MNRKQAEQYDRARQLLLSCWPHTVTPLGAGMETLIADLMVGFARMELRRAQAQREDA